jgi:hypothetical protein
MPPVAVERLLRRIIRQQDGESGRPVQRETADFKSLVDRPVRQLFKPVRPTAALDGDIDLKGKS